MPTPEAADTDFWARVALGLAGVGSAIGMIANALRPKKEEATAHVAKETVALTDDRPLRAQVEHMEAYLKRLADNSDVIVGLAREHKEGEERMRVRAEERIRVQDEESRVRLNERLKRLDEAEGRGR